MLNEDVPDRPATERLLVLVCYGLFILALVNGITFLIGGVMAHLRREESRGTVWADHYHNMIIVFWAAILLAALMMGFVFSGLMTAWSLMFWPGWMLSLPLLGMAAAPLLILLWLAFGVWYLYRILRGFFRALDDKPY
ncbi:MAG TPA: hypothetical protein VHV26_13350 [Rhizomicrobium sp.]|jgi:uncharacterized membrane protein|nr:hypothetical protein [Rhizomicrobium sp.]